MHTSFCLDEKGYSHISNGFNSWWDCKSGQRHTRQYITWGKPLRCETYKKNSSISQIKNRTLQWENHNEIGKLQTRQNSCKVYLQSPI